VGGRPGFPNSISQRSFGVTLELEDNQGARVPHFSRLLREVGLSPPPRYCSSDEGKSLPLRRLSVRSIVQAPLLAKDARNGAPFVIPRDPIVKVRKCDEIVLVANAWTLA